MKLAIGNLCRDWKHGSSMTVCVHPASCHQDQQNCCKGAPATDRYSEIERPCARLAG